MQEYSRLCDVALKIVLHFASTYLLTALLFKMEEANIASRAKAQEFIHATSQILSQSSQNQSSQHIAPSSSSSSSSSQVPNSSGPTPAQFILHGSLPLVGCTKTPPSHLHPGMSMGSGCAQTPPPPMPSGFSGGSGGSSDLGWDNESKDPDKYLKKLHTQERAVEEVKLAIKPYYQRKDINKDEYKDILRKAVHKICHSRTGEINPVKVSNLVKLYVQRYKYFRKHGRKMDEEEREDREMDSSY
uniref:SFR19-like C-terminal domain-containing protein n=1 Tax=Esox lucius TaxID=8010 RepID=A0AAY5K5B5_ESOLU